MALLIEPKHYACFAGVLEQVFRLHRRGGGQETDAFDHGHSIYLAVLDEAGQVAAAVRLIPSTEPNPARDVLGPQMGVTLPAGPHIVEMSRMRAAPGLDRDDRRAAMLDLRLSTVALALKRGWSHSVGVGDDRHIQLLISGGMTVQVLGPPVIFPGDREPSFAILASDPDRARRLEGQEPRLQDPAEDPRLIARYGERAVA
jgi:N-acyl-L-homoserine lactone synthetase